MGERCVTTRRAEAYLTVRRARRSSATKYWRTYRLLSPSGGEKCGLAIAASFCLLAALNAQQDTGRQLGGNQRGGSIANTIRTTPPGTRQSSDAFAAGRVEQPIYVSGQVVMPNGESPPELVNVEQHCSGVLRHDVHTKPNGNFNITQIGGSASVTDFDAGIGSSSTELTNRGTKLDAFGALDLTDCNVTAVLSGYQSTSVRLGRRRSLDSPDIGRIVLTPLAGVRGNTISVTSLEAPRKAKRSYENAYEESLKTKPDLKKMLASLNEAVKEYPSHAAAWELMGRTKLTEGDILGAREAFGKSIAGDPDFVRPYPPLIKIFAETGDFEAAIQAAAVALDLNPHADDVRFFQGVCQGRSKFGPLRRSKSRPVGEGVAVFVGRLERSLRSPFRAAQA